MTTTNIVELIAAGLMVIGCLGIIIHRIVVGMGIGARVIQLIAVILIVPAILILSLEKIFTAEIAGTLFGTITGYLLSGIGDFKSGQKGKNDNSENDSDKSP